VWVPGRVEKSQQARPSREAGPENALWHLPQFPHQADLVLVGSFFMQIKLRLTDLLCYIPPMSNLNLDPFQQGLQELDAAQQQREKESALAVQHFAGLMHTAAELGVSPDDQITNRLLIAAAVHLGAIEALDDPEVRHTQLRDLLIDFTVVGDTQTVAVFSAHTKMEPLSEQEMGIAAERIAQVDIIEKENAIIVDEIYDLLADIPGLPEPQDDSNLALFLTTLTGFCNELRHNTKDSDIELRRRNFMDKANDLIKAGGLNPALRQVVISLLQ
jgi:hypothetical protein